MSIKRLKKYLKREIKKIMESSDGHLIEEIIEIKPISDLSLKKRINILIPSINQEHIFGGIATALRFFNDLQQLITDVDFRIIVTDMPVTNKEASLFDGFELVNNAKQINYNHTCLIQSISDRCHTILPVRKNDLFIATAWWTAFNVKKIIGWQNNQYNIESSTFCYFIQDYEPFFYNTGSRYLLAESTYNSTIGINCIAIFNTKILYDYFLSRNYIFKHSFYFNPCIHPQMYNEYKSLRSIKKEKVIFIYGRPCTARNCFELIVLALQHLSIIYPKLSEWEIISAGTHHENILLQNNAKIISKGKLSIKDYTKLLISSYIGVSLMASPHPSYPPLDIVSFGGICITNSFANKNMSDISERIISIKYLTPDNLAESILKEMLQYDNKSFIEEVSDPFNENLKYLDMAGEFPFINDFLKKSQW